MMNLDESRIIILYSLKFMVCNLLIANNMDLINLKILSKINFKFTVCNLLITNNRIFTF